MNWKIKASIMSVCAALPAGDMLYRFIQGHFGRLTPEPFDALKTAALMTNWLQSRNISLSGKKLCEVGTGHLPLVPIGLFLCGAEEIFTFDLNQRMELDLLKQSLSILAENEDRVHSIFSGLVAREILSTRLQLITQHHSKPQQFLEAAKIIYQAPADAANTFLPDKSIDIHFSNNVFEHIPQSVLEKIMLEANRILKPEGFGLHFIDPSDHFAHQDNRISKINFLKFSDNQWNRYGGNQFAYCNRMRSQELLDLFERNNFIVDRRETIVDQKSLELLKAGFKIDKKYQNFSNEQICTTNLKVLLRPY